MKELEEIYNLLYDEYDKARIEHFYAASDERKNGDRIYLHGKVHGLDIALDIVGRYIDKT